MLSNNKFLGKCWHGGHPWIRLAMESESMVEKGINFIFCLGTAYDISSMESVGSSKSFLLVGKVCPSKYFLSLNFRFELWHLYKSLLPFVKGLSFIFQYLLLCKESKYSSLFLFIFSFGKHHVVRKDLGTYVQLNMGGMSYYC